MNYQQVRAAIETPILTAYNSSVPNIPVYFDNVANVDTDSVDEFVTVNIQFGLTTEQALTANHELIRGVIVIRAYTQKDKGASRNQTLVTTAFDVLNSFNSQGKKANGVYVRTRNIEGPAFGVGSPDQQSRRAFTPFFIGRIEAGFQATISA